MLKYKFEKYILLEARIKKIRFLTLRVTFTGHEFIFILNFSRKFWLSGSCSRLNHRKWPRKNVCLQALTLSLLSPLDFFTLSPNRKAVHRPSIALHLTLRFKTSSHTQGQIVGARESLNGRFFFPRPFRLSLVPTIAPWATRKRPNFGGCLRSCIGVLLRTV